MRTIILSGIAIFIPLAFASVPADTVHENPGDLLKRGAALIRAGRGAEAEGILNSLGEKDVEFPAAQTLLGYEFLRRSELDPAAKAFHRALAAEAGNASARFGLGTVLSRQGNLEDAANEFKAAFEDPALGVKARSQWVQIRFWMGKDREAYREAHRLAVQFPDVADYQSLEGFFGYVRGEGENARRAFERALLLEPGRMSDYYSLISLCRAQKDWQSALQWIRRAISLDPDQPLLYDEMASVCAKLGLSSEAEAAREESRRTYEAELLYAQSARARSEGRPGEAEDLLRRCIRLNPRLSKAWTDLGEALRSKNRLAEAQQDFERALQIDPSNHLAALGLAAVLDERTEDRNPREVPKAKSGENRPAKDPDVGVAHGGQQDDSTAAAIILRAVQNYPGDADLLAFLGRAQDTVGSPQAALEAYSEALRLDPLKVEAILGKAKSLLDAGEARRAIEEYRRATDLEPGNMRGWRGFVQALRAAGDPKQAEQACRQCLARNPDDPDCLEPLAYLKLNGGDYRTAAELFQTILREGRASKDLLDSQGFARMKLGEVGEAIGLFYSSLKRYGPDPWVYFNLGYLYQAQGNIGSAIANYRRARELSPQDPDISHNLGFALYLSREYASALEPLEAAVRLRPGWGLAHFNLAMAYWNLGQYAPALAHARIAEQKGIPGAAGVVRTLSTSLSPGTPRTVSVYRKK